MAVHHKNIRIKGKAKRDIKKEAFASFFGYN